jgi:N-acyl-phosphatidylethanolamine-hydrolysing phospholipase D
MPAAGNLSKSILSGWQARAAGVGALLGLSRRVAQNLPATSMKMKKILLFNSKLASKCSYAGCRNHSRFFSTATSSALSSSPHISSLHGSPASLSAPTNSVELSSTDSASAATRSMPVYKNGYFYNPWKTLWGSWTRLDQLKLVWQWRQERKVQNINHFTPGKGILELANAAAHTSHSIPQSHLHNNLLDITLPVLRPNFTNFLSSQQINYCWLGHATSLVNLHGLTILTDPFFSERTSAVQFLGPKRYRPAPCTVAELPALDIILLSHNHFDHIDSNSISAIYSKLQSQLKDTGKLGVFYVPLGVKPWLMKHFNIQEKFIVELNWWGKSTQNVSIGSNPSQSSASADSVATITATPAKHWSGRIILDRNRTLWCGFVVQFKGKKYYYSGDTGYGPFFKQIGAEFGGIDLASLPIGAYEPQKYFGHMHINPAEAVRIHGEIGSKKSIAVHWGTVELTDEFYLQPKFDLISARKAANVKEEEFFSIDHGQIVENV